MEIPKPEDYILKKTKFYDLPVEKIYYNYELYQSPKSTQFNKIIIHHTGKSSHINDIINTHIAKKKYSAIGYHFLIMKNGKIIYSRDLKFAGAHTFGYNKNGLGIALFGDLNQNEPTEKQILALKNLIREILSHSRHIKYLLGHNEAIYKQIKKQFWNLTKLPLFNISKYENVEDVQKLQLEISSKLLSIDPSVETINLIKRFKTCPGIKIYKIIVELRQEFNLKK